jgi:signal transduction histidine kinase
VLIVGLLYIYTNNEIQRIDNEIAKIKINDVQALSSRFALRVQYVTGMMELASQTFQMTEPPIYSNLISEYLKGIPQDADIEKRKIARNMFDKKLELEYIFYVMPNGDMYFLEPFSSQVKLSQLNFAFRDWYSGTMNIGSTYVSEVYVSANEKHNVIAIAVPIYGVNQTLNGIFVAAFDLGAVQRSLSQINHGKNEYFLIVDHNNNTVVDSRKSESDIEIKKFTMDLSDHQENKVNITSKTIGGQDHIIAFKTIPVGTHEWSIMSIQPHADAFASSTALRNETFGMIMTIVTITSMSGFFMIRKINANIHLSNRLKQNNSELELKTEQLKQINVLKDEFAAMMAHELKTPLVPIIGYAEMLLEDNLFGTLNPAQRDAAEKLYGSVKNLEALIHKMLYVQRLDLGNIKYNIEKIDISKLIQEIYDENSFLMKEKMIKFVNSTSTTTILYSDPIMIKEVFSNLIQNSVDFVPKDTGHIEINAHATEKGIQFFVKDNGNGIAKEKQGQLFKKFYQIDTSIRRKHGGTGLGLSICKKIVDDLNGKIWFESELDKGTTFFFEIPNNTPSTTS